MQKKRRISYLNNIKKIQKWWKKIYKQKKDHFNNYIVLPKILVLSKLFKKLYIKKFIRILSRYKFNKIVKCKPRLFININKKQLSSLSLNKKNNRSNSLIGNKKVNILSHPFTDHSNSAKSIHKRINTENNNKKFNLNLKTKSINICKNLRYKTILAKKLINSQEITTNIKLKRKTRSTIDNINRNNDKNIMMVICNEALGTSTENNIDCSKDLNLSCVNNTLTNSSVNYPTICSNEQNSINNNSNINSTIQYKSSYNFFSKFSPTCLVKLKRKTNNKTKLFVKFHKWKKFVEKMHIIELLKFQSLFNYKCKSFNKLKNSKNTYKYKEKIVINKLQEFFINLIKKEIKNVIHLIIENMFMYKKNIYFNRYRAAIEKAIILQKLKENKKNKKKENKTKKKEIISNININNFINYSNFSKNNISFSSLLTEKFDDFYQAYKNMHKFRKLKKNTKKYKNDIVTNNNERSLTMQINQLKMIFNLVENQRLKRFKSKKLLLKYYLNKWKIQKDKIRQKNNFKLIYHRKKLSFFNNLADNNINKNKNIRHKRTNTLNNLDSNDTFLERYRTGNTSLKDIRNIVDNKYSSIKYKQNSIEEKEVVFPNSIIVD